MDFFDNALLFFMDLFDKERLPLLIQRGGYPLLFAIVFSETGLMVGFFLPGDSLLVTAGIIWAIEKLNPFTLCLLLSAAAILGDNTGYWIGRRTGPLVFRRSKSLFFNPAHMERARTFYEKYGGKTVVLARFLPILRTFAPVVAGVGRMAYRRYILFSVTGGIAWIFIMILIGYFLGQFAWAKDNLHIVIVVVIAVSFLPGVVEFIRARAERNAA